jgi:protein gp37
VGKSDIEWTEETWNPVRGCALESPGCKNCYAMRQAHRFSGKGKPYEGLTRLRKKGGPVWTGEFRFAPEMLDVPLRRKKPTTYFVNSMSDLFGEGVTNEQIAAVFAVMAVRPQHRFQVLTKRARRMREWFEWMTQRAMWHAPGPIVYASAYFTALRLIAEKHGISNVFRLEPKWPLPNVWLGASVEDQERADERIPELLRTPAAIRFISAEPLLGLIDLTKMEIAQGVFCDPLLVDDAPLGLGRVRHLDWIITGGESGNGARPCDVAWIESIVAQARAASVPVFVKQLGACFSDPVNGLAGCSLDVPQEAAPLIRKRLVDKKGGDMAEWPEKLRVREMPARALQNATT